MPARRQPLDVPFDEMGIGDTLESRGRTATEADIVAYASLSGDWTQLHTDAVAQQPYRSARGSRTAA